MEIKAEHFGWWTVISFALIEVYDVLYAINVYDNMYNKYGEHLIETIFAIGVFVFILYQIIKFLIQVFRK